MKKIWRIIAKALGEKNGATDKEADMVALVRLGIMSSVVLSNIFIIINIIYKW
jgi:hypothetical protein